MSLNLLIHLQETFVKDFQFFLPIFFYRDWMGDF